MTRWRFAICLVVVALLVPTLTFGQAGPAQEDKPMPPRPGPWRNEGNPPCLDPWGAIYECTPPPSTVAIRAGRMFDSLTGQVLTNQVIIVTGQKIADVGPQASVTIPAGTRIIDLSQATVLPGYIDTHNHILNTRGKMTEVQSMATAIRNAKLLLDSGFTSVKIMSTHNNGYQDVELRDFIINGIVDGPRMRVSGRGIAWGSKPPEPGEKDDGLHEIVVRSVEEGRAAVDTEIDHGADHIKLFPAGGYKFNANAEPEVELTYPMPVLQAMIDEAHRRGVRTGCHAYGGQGLINSVIAGCDGIEHGFTLSQADCNLMAKKGLYYDPTLVRYSGYYMDDADIKGGTKGRIVPIFLKNAKMCIATKGVVTVLGTGSEGSSYAQGTSGNEFIALVKLGGMTPAAALQAGTINGAKLMQWDSQIGSITKGKFADIVAVPGNPLTDISEARKVRFVMKGGKVIKNEVVAGTVGAVTDSTVEGHNDIVPEGTAVTVKTVQK
jgi:imidazolonepropionase-like amidohydrolase